MGLRLRTKILGALMTILALSMTVFGLCFLALGRAPRTPADLYWTAVEHRWRRLPGLAPNADEWSNLVEVVLAQYAEQHAAFHNENQPLGVTIPGGFWVDALTVRASDAFQYVTESDIDYYAEEYGQYNFVTMTIVDASLSRLWLRLDGATEVEAKNVIVVETRYRLNAFCSISAGTWRCTSSEADA